MANLAKEPFVPEVVEVDYEQLGKPLAFDGEENHLGGIEVFEMGLAWDRSTGGRGVTGWLSRKMGSDLDAVLVAYTNGTPVKYLGWDELDCFQNGSAVHSGDNKTGEGSGDDETIRLELGKIPARYDKLVLVAAAFKPGSSMSRAKNITVTLYDSTGGQKQPVGFIEPSLLSPKNTMGVAVLTRQPGGHWTLRVTDRRADSRQGDRDSLLLQVAGF